jgi:hypothetical protein
MLAVMARHWLGSAIVTVVVFGAACSSSSTAGGGSGAGSASGSASASSSSSGDGGSASGNALDEAFVSTCTGTFSCTGDGKTVPSTAALSGGACTFTFMGMDVDLAGNGTLSFFGITVPGTTWTISSSGTITITGEGMNGTCSPSSS